MVYGLDEQKAAIRDRARILRSAASMIPQVKTVMEKFNGKCYNCKLDNAIKALSEENPDMRLYASVSYGGWYQINCYPKRGRNFDTSILYAYSTKENSYMTDDSKRIFTAEKRLDAKKAAVLLNENYSGLMKRAAELDRAADELDEYLSRIANLKKTLSAVVDSVPYEVRDICGVKY